MTTGTVEKGAWTKERIYELIMSSTLMVERSILQLYARQTPKEQDMQHTEELNHKGFNGWDAEFGSSLAEQIRRGKKMSPTQLVHARRMLKKYCGQLAIIANEKVG